MLRELTYHKVVGVGGLNEELSVDVMDKPGSGGACHDYSINWDSGLDRGECHIRFQNGPIQEGGVNGVSNESLLAVVLDRLVGFNEGEYATPENFAAMQHVLWALQFLHNRTKDRVVRGVEGTYKK